MFLSRTWRLKGSCFDLKKVYLIKATVTSWRHLMPLITFTNENESQAATASEVDRGILFSNNVFYHCRLSY